jgi:hypothetical protein
MKGEAIVEIYLPKNEGDKICIQTSQDQYEMRMGGFVKLIHDLDLNNFTVADFIGKGLFILEVWTDKESVYIKFEKDSFIVVGDLLLDSSGETHQAFYNMKLEELDEDERDFNSLSYMSELDKEGDCLPKF